MQSIFASVNEMTKPSCVRVSSQVSFPDPLATPLISVPSRKVTHRVSIGATSQTCPIPSRYTLPDSVTVINVIKLQTDYNKSRKSSLLDDMELEHGFRCRMGNTPAMYDAHLCQLEQYHVHDMCAKAVLTIRVTTIHTSAVVLDTGVMCSTSNNPGEILDISPSTVLLKPVVGAPQYMNKIRMSVPTYDIVDDYMLFDVPGQGVALPGSSSSSDL